MKKRIIALLIVFITIITLCGCETSTITQNVREEIQKEPVTEVVYGNYFLFETRDEQEYLNFLEDLDEAKYEIVDISVNSYSVYYYVTYKVKEIEAS